MSTRIPFFKVSAVIDWTPTTGTPCLQVAPGDYHDEKAARSQKATVVVEGVRKAYMNGKMEHVVLDGVNFQASAGESVFLCGPSGSGKSTLLAIMGCLLDFDSGRVEIDGRDIRQLTNSQKTHIRRSKIGFVFQRFQLIQALTALDNVSVPLTLQGISLPKAREKSHRLLTRVGLQMHASKLPHSLSPGQCQRVALVRAISTEPSLVLADEPTAALDGNSGMNVMELLKELVEGSQTTTIVVTHDPRILKYADRVCEIENGCFK